MAWFPVVAAAALVAVPAFAGVFIEAESFAEKGGWSVDAQHMLEMGSPYLLAHGLGVPVADASAEFDSAGAGEYFLWVRTRNWTAPWSEHPAGLFGVSVNGVDAGFDFGAGSGDWHWERAPGKVRLRAGRNRVALSDRTGFDGRVDAIAFTKDDVPPVRPSAPSPAAEVRADFTVVGGGVAGICAAVAAARAGLRVALVQDRPVLGGNNSSEVRVHLGGHQQCGRYPRLGDVVAEIGPEFGGNARPAGVYEDGRKLAVVEREKNISLFLGTKVLRVEKGPGGGVAAVIGRDVATGAETRFLSPLFCDATGDGTVGFLAGADFRMGRESRAETGETKAPERADTLTMGASCQWLAAVSASPAPFPRRPWMLTLDENTSTHALRGDWDWETGLGRDQVAEAERIRDYGMLVAYSNWAFLKNDSTNRADFADKRLDWVAYVAGKRESRRLLGDVVLTDEDVRSFREYPDGTCLASWSIDLHYPRTPAETGFAGESFRSKCEQEKIALYPIPYRCLYSRNIPNLFMAGRDISVTHNALGTVRVMRTTGMMGEVVGMAAAVCREHGCLPRDVYESRFDELKARMERGAGAGLRQSAQAYNVHPTLGLDLADREAVREQSREEWGTVNLFRGDDGRVFRRQEVSPVLKNGAFSIGHAYARILCFAKNRPFLETGRTPECGTPRELVPYEGRSGVWMTPDMVAFDYCRVKGDVDDVRFETIAVKPFPLDTGEWWQKRFAEKKREISALRGKVDLVFMGDSLTHIWETRCPGIIADLKRDFTLLNLGYSGDRVENLLWRITRGEAVNYRAKCIMLEIGTNNSRSSPEEIAAGIRTVLNKLLYAQPQAKIILLPVFPRRDSENGIPAPRPGNDRVNGIIREFADGEQVIWLDFTEKMLDGGGDTLWCMPDRLHPQTEGLKIWYENVLPEFRRICGKSEPVRTAGWECRGWTRPAPPPAKVLWRAADACPGGFTLEKRGGAEGRLDVSNGVLRVHKTNGEGYLLVKAAPFRAPAGRMLQFSAEVSCDGAVPEYSHAFLRAHGKDEFLGCDPKTVAAGHAAGWPEACGLVNTAPGVSTLKFFNYLPADGVAVPVMVVGGEPSRSEWRNWLAEDREEALAAWRRDFMTPGNSGRRERPSPLPDDEFDRFIAADVQHTARLVRTAAGAYLEVDGRPVPPSIYEGMRHLSDYTEISGARGLIEAGVPMAGPIVIGAGGKAQKYSVTWTKEGGYDATKAVAHVRETMRAGGGALLHLQYSCNAYPEFAAEEHPEDIWVDDSGKPVVGTWGSSTIGYSGYTAGSRAWPWISMSSRAWREAIKSNIRAFVAEMKRRGLDKRLVSIHFCGYNDGQLGMNRPDYSPCAKAEYREYLKEVAGTGLSTNYWHFCRQIPARAVNEFGMCFKEAMGKDVVVLRRCDSPFVVDFAFGANTRSPGIDISVTGPAYDYRAPGLACATYVPFSSMSANGRMVWNEFDLRTWWIRQSGSPQDCRWCGCAEDIDSWRAIYRKLAGEMIAVRGGWWFYDMGRGWFAAPGVAEDVADSFRTVRTLQEKEPSRWRPDTALVVDEEGFFGWDGGERPVPGHTYQMVERQIRLLATAGVPYEYYLAEDVLRRPELLDGCRTVVFLLWRGFDARRAAFVRKLREKATALVYIAESASLGGEAEAATGFKIDFSWEPKDMEVRPAKMMKEPVAGVIEMERRRGGAFGTAPGGMAPPVRDRRGSIAETPGTVVLGRFADDGSVAIAKRRYGKCLGYCFTEPGGLSPRAFNRIVRNAGGYAPVEAGCLQVNMNGDFLSVHALANGRFDFVLPPGFRAINVKSGREEKMRDGAIPLCVSAGETCWFLLSAPIL